MEQIAIQPFGTDLDAQTQLAPKVPQRTQFFAREEVQRHVVRELHRIQAVGIGPLEYRGVVHGGRVTRVARRRIAIDKARET